MTFKVKGGINIGNINVVDNNSKYQQTLDLPIVDPTLYLDFINQNAVDPRITFSRASAGTYYDANGLLAVANTNQPRFNFLPTSGVSRGMLIEGARTNLCWHSENMNGVSSGSQDWSYDGSSIAPIVRTVTGLAPDGSATAFLVDDQSTASSGGVVAKIQTIPVTGSTNVYAVSCYVKAGTSGCASIRAAFNGTTNVVAEVVINMATGAVQWRGGVVGTNIGTESVGNGWYRVYLTLTDNNTGATSLILLLRPAFNSTYSTSLDQTATGSTYFWGLQAEVGVAPSTYVSSTQSFTSRASLASYQDSTDGLIKYAGVNMLTYSNIFSDASWGKGGVTTITANADYAPDGTNTAWRLQMPATSGTVLNHAISVVSGTTYTFSVYAKGNIINSTFSMFFELASGSANPASTNLISTVTGTWTRYSVSYTATTTGTIYATFDNVGVANPVDILIWGAQVEVGSTPTLYSNTTSTTTGAYRPKYNSITKQNQYGILEAAATNLLPQSAIRVGWIYSTETGINNVTAPDGTTTAATITAPVGVSLTQPHYSGIVVTAATVYTWSFYIKLGTLVAADYKFAIYDETNSVMVASQITPTVTPVSYEWRRVTYTFTTPAGCVAIRPYAYRNDNTGAGGTFYWWGGQMEAGYFASSYIPTLGGTATRAADVYISAATTRAADLVNMSNIAPWFDATQGTFVAEFDVTNSTTTPFVVKGDGAEYVTSRNDTTVGTWNGTTQIDAITATANTQRNAVFAISYGPDGRAMSLNGGIANTGSGNFNASTIISLGSDGAGNRSIGGHIKRVSYYPVVSSNTRVRDLSRT